MTDKVDYLDEDPMIPSQKFCVISVLTPKNFKQSPEKDYKPEEIFPVNELPALTESDSITLELYNNLISNQNKLLRENASLKTQLSKYKQNEENENKKITMYTFKVRGSYESQDDAQKRIQYLNSIDSNVNIYLAEVGKWCPFDDDPEKAKDAVYKDEELNKLMKGYKDNQEKGKQFFEQRKAEMVSKALDDTKQKKEKLKQQSEQEKQSLQEKINSDDSSVNVKMEDTLLNKEKVLKEKELKIKDSKKEIEDKKSQIHSKEDKLKKLNDEMAAAKKKYEEHMAKVASKSS